MTVQAPTALTFAEVDDLAFAVARGRLDSAVFERLRLSVDNLGPFLEVRHLAADGVLPPPQAGAWLAFNHSSEFYRAIVAGRHQWLCGRSRSSGFLRTEAKAPADPAVWTAFGLAAQKAAAAVGFPRKIAGQLVGALIEMQSNIYEHSEAPESGVLAFRALRGVFELVVADHGIGVLESLKSGPAHANLADHGTALQLALTEGCSRHGDGIGRGLGFRPLFVGLANFRGALRFRSGDHALTIDGDHPKLIMARLAQKPQLRGFFASIRCTWQGSQQ